MSSASEIRTIVPSIAFQLSAQYASHPCERELLRADEVHRPGAAAAALPPNVPKHLELLRAGLHVLVYCIVC